MAVVIGETIFRPARRLLVGVQERLIEVSAVEGGGKPASRLAASGKVFRDTTSTYFKIGFEDGELDGTDVGLRKNWYWALHVSGPTA